MANASRKMGHGVAGPKGFQHVGPQNPDEAFDEDDLASDIKGKNKLQGLDQERAHSERHAVAESSRKTEGVVESFERMDPKVRAGGD